MSEVLVGRQPIFDRQLEVYAYELLFRGDDLDLSDPAAGDLATSRVIVNTFTEIGLERLVSNKRAFLNLTRAFITGEHPLPIPPGNVVLEVLESVAPDPEVLEGLARLRDAGFKIALDDFVLDAETCAFMEFADLVKVDVLGKAEHEIRAEVDLLKEHGVILLAEKIETREEFEAYKEMGFDYFQGFFLERPSEVRTRSVHPEQVTLLSLLHELHSPGFNFKRAEVIVKQDVGLCYRLLRHINSVLYGMPRKIKSVRETLIYLGVENVQNLTSLFLLASHKDMPTELITAAMLRARMCENLGKEKRDPQFRQFFIVGLFSSLDALMQVPMKELLGRLPLSEQQKAALTDGEGDMGTALAAVRAYERGDWEHVQCFGLSAGKMRELYLEAMSWAEEVAQQDKREAA